MTDSDIDKFMKERKRRFGKFYLENVDKLQSYGDHPIINDAVSLWRERIRNGAQRVEQDKGRLRNYTLEVGYDAGLQEEYDYKTWDQIEELGSQTAVKLSAAFAMHMRYVSKDAFLAETNRIVQMIQGYAMGEMGVYAEPRKIAWFVHHASGRSDTWVTLLMWARVSQYVDALVASHAEIHELAQKDGWDDMLVVMTDDAAYSGGQIFNRMSEYPLEFPEDVGGERVQFFIAVPFMTNQAIRHATRPSRLGSDYVKVPDFKGNDAMTTMEESLGEGEFLDELRALFSSEHSETHPLVSGFRLNHVPVYFAHKLADLVSIPNFLFALAPYLDIDDRREIITIRRMTLIGKCRPEDYTYDLYPEADDPDNDFLQNDGKVCPIPPYKTIQYTWNGVSVDKDDNIVVALGDDI